MSDLIDAWGVHARIQLYVLDAIADEALDASSMKGRGVGHQFSHIHDVRRMWLKAAGPELVDDIEPLGKNHVSDRSVLTDALTRSASAIAALVERAEAGRKISGFTASATAFVGYLISHESYHQGDIGVRLTEGGFPLDKKTAYGMWEWGVR